ncbi:hypothetical protein MASR1M31_02360 [Porphyromonadaceae bacterium]
MRLTRREVIKSAIAGALLSVPVIGSACNGGQSAGSTSGKLKGNIRHSVSKWCFGDIPLEEFCVACKEIGIESIELLDPKDWPIVQKHGLTVAMPQGAGFGIDKGFNITELHDDLVKSYEEVIPKVAEAGLTNLICFSGVRRGVTDEEGWENCAKEVETTDAYRRKIQSNLGDGVAQYAGTQRLSVQPYGLGRGVVQTGGFAQPETTL